MTGAHSSVCGWCGDGGHPWARTHTVALCPGVCTALSDYVRARVTEAKISNLESADQAAGLATFISAREVTGEWGQRASTDSQATDACGATLQTHHREDVGSHWHGQPCHLCAVHAFLDAPLLALYCE